MPPLVVDYAKAILRPKLYEGIPLGRNCIVAETFYGYARTGNCIALYERERVAIEKNLTRYCVEVKYGNECQMMIIAVDLLL